MQGKDQKPWRTLEELAGTAAHEDWLHREFAPLASEWPDGPSRRNFLKLMGASVALAGASAGIGGGGGKKGGREGAYCCPRGGENGGGGAVFFYGLPAGGGWGGGGGRDDRGGGRGGEGE